MTAPLALLAADSVAGPVALAGTMSLGATRQRAGWGSVVGRLGGRGFRRAEQGPCGPLLLEVRPHASGVDLQVWGAAETPSSAAERALEDTRRWAGLQDDTSGFDERVDAHPVLRRLRLELGTPVLGALPRAAESFGRAVFGQLVQGSEAIRTTAQVIAMVGTPSPLGLWAYPTREAIGSVPAHRLRRCGVSLRGAVALHRFAVDEPAYQRLAEAQDWHAMDAALVRLPGVAGWTSAETRLWLGDADAVSVGDYHIPAVVGWALGERTEDDASMLALLAPYPGHRGRVIRLLERGARRGLVDAKPRHGPRAALSEHRYW